MEQTPIGSKNVIYLPSFEIKHSTYTTHPKFLQEELKIEQDDKEVNISKFMQNNEICFKHDMTSVNEFYIPDHGNDIIIEKDFLVALINYEIFQDVHIPVVSVFIVRKSDFQK
jgi:hypothetical protein